MNKKMSDVEKFVGEAVGELLAKTKTGGEINNVVFVVEDGAREEEEGESSIRRDEVLLGAVRRRSKDRARVGVFEVPYLRKGAASKVFGGIVANTKN